MNKELMSFAEKASNKSLNNTSVGWMIKSTTPQMMVTTKKECCDVLNPIKWVNEWMSKTLHCAIVVEIVSLYNGCIEVCSK